MFLLCDILCCKSGSYSSEVLFVPFQTYRTSIPLDGAKQYRVFKNIVIFGGIFCLNWIDGRGRHETGVTQVAGWN